jgi:putative acetyltransferase
MLSVTRETPDQTEVLHLLRLADERSSSLYPAERRHGPNVATLVTQGVRFFVARLEGVAVGCGGYIPCGNGVGELKRMFVDSKMRGQGIGRALLQNIEDEASREGIRVLQLETGVKSLEARGLYRQLGYRERGPFGGYNPDPLSVFMEKELG